MRRHTTANVAFPPHFQLKQNFSHIIFTSRQCLLSLDNVYMHKTKNYAMNFTHIYWMKKKFEQSKTSAQSLENFYHLLLCCRQLIRFVYYDANRASSISIWISIFFTRLFARFSHSAQQGASDWYSTPRNTHLMQRFFSASTRRRFPSKSIKLRSSESKSKQTWKQVSIYNLVTWLTTNKNCWSIWWDTRLLWFHVVGDESQSNDVKVSSDGILLNSTRSNKNLRALVTHFWFEYFDFKWILSAEELKSNFSDSIRTWIWSLRVLLRDW